VYRTRSSCKQGQVQGDPHLSMQFSLS
jgi:hypothetical protein